MTVLSMSNIVRGVAIASLMTLAACQVPPKRTDNNAANKTAATQSSNAQQASQQQDATNTAAPAITFHLAQTQQAKGLVRLQLNPNATLYVLPQPVLSQADLQQIVPIQAKDGKVFLRFDFTKEGAAKLTQISRQSVGRYLIISAHGKLVSIPQITAAYENGQLPVPVKSVADARAKIQLLRQPAN